MIHLNFLKKSKYNRGFPGGSDGQESACNAGDPSLIPGSGRSPGEGIGYPVQYLWASLVAQMVKSACIAGHLGSTPGLERSPEGGRVWQPTPVFLPWTEEPGKLQSMGLQRIRHD